jgi:hypothetical protein
MRVLAANLLWVASSLPGWLRFRRSLEDPRAAQRRVRRGLLAANRDSAQGRRLGFAGIRDQAGWRSLPVHGYDDHRADILATAQGQQGLLCSEPVLLLEPTSGSSGPTRLIPYTASLQREFQAAIDPWILNLFLQRPGLLRGRHYWSISPATPWAAPDGCVLPVGFAADAEYLGRAQRWLTRALFPVPAALREVQDPAAHGFITALFLVAELRLGLISVWHPSFLLLLLEGIIEERDALVAALRSGRIPADLDLDDDLRGRLQARLRPALEQASLLEAVGATEDLHRLWPRLQVISCWDQGRAQSDALRLAELFPEALVQGKGLMATEGVVSIPWWGGAKLCAVGSHLLEFEGRDGRVHGAHELIEGGEYAVLISTGGGLVRYRLGDRVRCTGFVGRTPTIDFVARLGGVVDLVGEKLHPEQVEAALREVEGTDPFAFAMLAPEPDGRGYRCYLEAQGAQSDLAARLEALLAANYHYAHARRAGQLRALVVQPVDDGMARYRAALVARGQRLGDIKQEPLRGETFWAEVFG